MIERIPNGGVDKELYGYICLLADAGVGEVN